jgi:colanic acid biosynthesis glycosyl transferase WcaI
MRILLLTQWFQPEPFFKGLPFAKALRARGHDVEVLTGFPNYPGGKLYPGYRVRLWQRESMDGIRVNRVALYPSHDGSGLHRILNYLSFAFLCLGFGPLLVRKPDIIYVYNLVSLCPAAFLLRWFLGCKVILDVQDLWPESVIRSGMLPHTATHRVLSTVCSWIYRRVDWLSVLSPGFKRALQARGVASNKLEVIYNWCDETAQGPVTRDQGLRQELGLDVRFNVFFAGTMGVMQSLDTVLNAAQLCRDRVPQAQFVLMGGGVDRPRLETKAAEMGVNNVQFLPPQPPQMMGKFYALADALLVHLKDDPLFRITIPSKTQTYLYMAKPIIMALRGDAADLVRQAGAGVICTPQDAGGLSDAVARLAAMRPEDRERLGKAGASFYAANLSMKNGVDRFERRMLELVSSR